MRAKLIRLFKNLQNFKDIFQKKKFKNFGDHQVASPLGGANNLSLEMRD